ncbi:hypothetical protein H3C61_02010 [Candidatus Gracilibacteria bacterium]|nr:hypothetical protein [Candidatus Gracilibacteria bacterium]
MNKIFLFLISFFYTFLASASLKDSMMPNSNTIGVSSNGTGVINEVLISFKDLLFYFLGFIAIGVFLYFGFKLITSRGNEEEFKKTLMGFVYAVIGLAIIPLAYGAVKLIASLKI